MVENLATGAKEIQAATTINPVTNLPEPIIEGLRGRIPMRLLETLTTSTKFDGVFKNTRFDAFIGLNSETLVRGLMFPPDLLRYNTALMEIPNLFDNIRFPIGVDINSNLFYNLVNLTNISQVFANCQFNKEQHALSIEAANNIYPQIDFINLFRYNQRLNNVSGLFANYMFDANYPRGLHFIHASLFSAQYNINNISNMFFDNRKMIALQYKKCGWSRGNNFLYLASAQGLVIMF